VEELKIIHEPTKKNPEIAEKGVHEYVNLYKQAIQIESTKKLLDKYQSDLSTYQY